MAPTRHEILSRGTYTFCDLDFHVSPGVLIPRKETELLAYTAAQLLEDVPDPHIIDMCCGSGNLTCTLALRYPSAVVYGADLTPHCVRLAQRNVSRHGVGDRVSIHQGDLFQSLKGLGIESSVHMVICNPPYIPATRLETTSRELLDLEPREAFDAGAYGMDIIARLLVDAAEFLESGRPLCFEFGAGQHRMCKWMLDRSKLYGSVRFVCDENGVERVAVALRA